MKQRIIAWRCWAKAAARICNNVVLPLAPSPGYPAGMASWEEVTTYDDLQKMTYEGRAAHFRACIVLDPATLSAEAQQRLAEMDAEMDAREAATRQRRAS